jgi:ribonuclease HI
VTYLSQRLVDAETRYTFIEKLCLCLFYACTKCRCYLLSSHCTVSGQADVIKYMLHNPILSGRIGKRAYALIEYDLAYEPLKSMRGQVVSDFIVEHRINDTHKLDMSYLTITPWTLYFDGSVCNEGQGIGIVLASPSDVSFDFSSRLKIYCTNNQAEYEALLFGLELLNCMGVKHVRAFGDSQLIVQHVLEEYQCFDGTLNSYLEKCWGIIHFFDEFSIRHISRVENHRANNLAQDASGYRIKRGRFHNTENLITGAGPIPQVADRPSKDSCRRTSQVIGPTCTCACLKNLRQLCMCTKQLNRICPSAPRTPDKRLTAKIARLSKHKSHTNICSGNKFFIAK